MCEEKIIETTEVIFQTPLDDKNDRNNKTCMFGAYFQPSDYFIDTIEGDPRDTVAIAQLESGAYRNNKYNGSTYNGQTLTADTQYFLRLDEIYLIYAEAVLRSNGLPSD